jgi:HK97 family phage major capsid protein
MTAKLPNVIAAVTGQVWALEPQKMEAVLAVLQLHRQDGRASADDIRAAIGAGPDQRSTATPPGVAVIPITGMILPRATGIQESSGLMSLARISAMFDTAMRDQSISAIVLDIDSPGGMVAGVPEFAAKVFAARGVKPVIAVANTLAASAAYWIGAAAEEFVASPSADVGSIGIITVHLDASVANEAEGLKYTVLTAGRYKGEGNPFEPLSDEAREYAQSRLDDAYGQFVGTVAKGRNVPVATVRDSFGQGRVIGAKKALAAGMIDRVASLEDVLAKLTGRRRGSSSASATAIDLPLAAGSYSLSTETLQAESARLIDALAQVGFGMPAAGSGPSVPVLMLVPERISPHAAQPAERNDKMNEPTVPAPAESAVALQRANAELARRDGLDHLRRTYPEQATLIDGALASGRSLEAVKDDILAAQRDALSKRPAVVVGGPNTSGALPNEATQPFASFGEQMVAIVQAGKPAGRRDIRLAHINAQALNAASGMNESVGSEGGYFIAPQLLPGVITPVYEQDPLLQRVKRIPLSGNSIVYNVIDETSRANGSRQGGMQMYWVAEADTATAKKPSMRQVRLALKKIMGVGYLTEELQEDAPAAEALLTEAFQTELQFMLGDSIFRGSGAGQPLGFLNGPATASQAIEATQTIANSHTFIATNLAKMMSRIPASLWGELIWLYNPEFLPTLIVSTIGTSAVPVFMGAGGLANRPSDTILGRPAFASDLCEAVGTPGDIVAIAPSQYHMTDKGGVNAMTSVHVRFLYDEQTLKITYRADGQPLWVKALTPFKGSATRSPYVTLAVRA